MTDGMAAAFIASSGMIATRRHTGPHLSTAVRTQQTTCTAEGPARSGAQAGRRPRSTGLSAVVVAAAAAGVLLVQTAACGPPVARADVIQAPQCIEGEGPGCASNEDENPLVKKLLEKTRVNKEKNQAELRDHYWQQGYGDYFSFGYDKKLVQGSDGKWRLEEPDDPFLKAARRVRDIVNDSKTKAEASSSKPTSSSTSSSTPQ